MTKNTLIDQFATDTPQSHQSGVIAQAVEQIDELKASVIGGEIGNGGQETIRCLNYNVVFSYAAEAVQELSEIVKGNNRSKFMIRFKRLTN